MSGLTLGVNIAVGTAYNTVITSPPYNWPNSSASYVNAGQIMVSLIGLPLFGYGSDKLVKWRADRNGGVHEPETRLILLIIPICVGVLSCMLFGQAILGMMRGFPAAPSPAATAIKAQGRLPIGMPSNSGISRTEDLDRAQSCDHYKTYSWKTNGGTINSGHFL